MLARVKIMTVFVTMVAMFAMLPALSAVAAEPLDDGTYTVAVEDQSLRLAVVDGEPLVSDAAGVEWVFSYDEDGRVLDEFNVVVDGTAYEVEIGEDGTAFVKPADEPVVVEPDPTVPLADDEVEVDEDDEAEEEVEVEDEEDESEEDAGHGELVSAVAKCVPNGRTARDAGLPNHGAVVSAVAKGDTLEFTVADTDYVLDPAEGAEAVCATMAEALAAGEAAAAEAAEAEGSEDARPGNGNKKSDGEAPGKSGDAPGKAKKNADG